MAADEMIIIRPAAADDAERIATAFDAVVCDEDQAVGPANVQLVAIDERGEVVGFTAAHPRDGDEILLFVHPGRDRGVGRALLGAARTGRHRRRCTKSRRART